MEQQLKIRKLGELLKSAREAKGLSARQLSEQIGIHHTTVSLVERAQIEQPRPDKLSKLAAALDLDLTDLLTLAGYPGTDGLPAFGVYLRTTTGLPDAAIEELRGHFDYLRTKYGLSAGGPALGEDETDNEDE